MERGVTSPTTLLVAVAVALLAGCANGSATAPPSSTAAANSVASTTSSADTATTSPATPIAAATTTTAARAVSLPFVLAPTSYASRGVFITPDPALTPGATDPRVTPDSIDSTICTAGYSTSVRPPTSITTPIKKREMTAYGYQANDLSSFELDHLISLELGGAPADSANLWPEPWATHGLHHVDRTLGAETKDTIESALHRAVCAHRVDLRDAQQRIATDWRHALDGSGLSIVGTRPTNRVRLLPDSGERVRRR